MRLMKNPEITRLLGVLLALLVVFILLAIFGISVSMRMFTEPLHTQQAALVGTLLERYPDAEQELIRQLTSADEEAVQRGEAMLARYGFAADDLLLYDSELLVAQSRIQTWLYLAMIAIVFAVLSMVFFLFIRRRYRTVALLHDYARDIVDGRETLDIRDNGEGEFSILKNQIYTITTMLKEQKAALQREKLGLSDSIADISHQLKTPLTSLSVMTDLLMDEPSPEMRAEFLSRIRAQLDRLEWLVSSLLKLSKLDVGTVKMKRERFLVTRLIQRAMDTLSIPLETKQHDVTISGDPDAEIIGDIEWTTEALINILKNSIEHTPDRGELRISWEVNPIYTRIVIADNGVGIDPTDLPHIFTRFYRGKNASNDSVGIGLAMAQSIVKQQHGDIMARSELGSGTSFVITFYKGNV